MCSQTFSLFHLDWSNSESFHKTRPMSVFILWHHIHSVTPDHTIFKVTTYICFDNYFSTSLNKKFSNRWSLAPFSYWWMLSLYSSKFHLSLVTLKCLAKSSIPYSVFCLFFYLGFCSTTTWRIQLTRTHPHILGQSLPLDLVGTSKKYTMSPM